MEKRITTFIDKPEKARHSLRALIEGDCRQLLPFLDDASVSLTHTSPPYNIRRRYSGFRDRQDITRYRKLLEDVVAELHRVTKPGGSVFWQVGYTTEGPAENGEAQGIKILDAVSLPIFEAAGFRLWDRIVWNYFGSMAFKSKFTNRYETILWLVKPAPDGSVSPLFQLDEIRERSKSYDGRNHVLGRNPGNVWYSERVAFGSVGQTSHIAVFPEEVSEKIVRACSRPGELVLDPFVGSGTLSKVALTLGRRFVGCEISEEYIREADTRLRMWGWSEVENLALGLLVKYGFHGRTGTKPLRYLSDVLGIYASRNGLPDDYVGLQLVVGEILNAQRVTKTVKARKQRLWEEYDRIIDHRDESDEVIAADRALNFCYAHRKQWNGVRRYLTAGRHLAELQGAINSAGGTEDFVASLCRRANARFQIRGRQVRCLRTDPGLGCNEQPKARQPESSQQEIVFA